MNSCPENEHARKMLCGKPLVDVNAVQDVVVKRGVAARNINQFRCTIGRFVFDLVLTQVPLWPLKRLFEHVGVVAACTGGVEGCT